jgi:hypothetical protein
MGQGGVGKTAMVTRYRDNEFVAGYMPTIADMYTWDMQTAAGPRHCEIDDTAGQVRKPPFFLPAPPLPPNFPSSATATWAHPKPHAHTHALHALHCIAPPALALAVRRRRPMQT